MCRVVRMTAKALVYAEETLGVHAVYEQAQAARKELDECLTLLAEARDSKRDLEVQLSDREMEITALEFGKHADMAQWRMEKHVKQAVHTDEGWRAIRDKLTEVLKTIEGLELDRTMAEQDIKIAVSRMGELGGYLSYLAEVKRAANTMTPETTEQT